MPSITVDRFVFELPEGSTFLKYDDCTYYRKHFNDFASSKAVDLLVLTPRNAELWMVEIKDYRIKRRANPVRLFDEVAAKVRDTLAGLAAARITANDPQSQAFAADAMRAERFRVVFLLEQPRKPSKLFPRVVDPATASTALRKALRAVDPHALFVDASVLTERTAWTVTAP